jgi:hypothetical protein
MSDCLYEYECNSAAVNLSPVSFRASNGHICGSLFFYGNKAKLKLSGPRFLLPGAGAGINLTTQELDEKVFMGIEKYHNDIVFDTVLKELIFLNQKKLYLHIVEEYEIQIQ